MQLSRTLRLYGISDSSSQFVKHPWGSYYLGRHGFAAERTVNPASRPRVTHQVRVDIACPHWCPNQARVEILYMVVRVI